MVLVVSVSKNFKLHSKTNTLEIVAVIGFGLLGKVVLASSVLDYVFRRGKMEG